MGEIQVKNVEFIRTCVASRLTKALVMLHTDIGSHSEPDYEVLTHLSFTALRGELKTPPGKVFLDELVAHVMDKLGHVTEVTNGMSRVARVTGKQLRG